MHQLLCVVVLLIPAVPFCNGNQSANIYKDTRIVGGFDADIRELPYQVSLQYFNQHFCGGSLITTSFVLSAAHCFPSGSNSNPLWYSVKVGGNSTKDNDGIRVDMCSVKVHENYNSSTIDNDISIIKLCSNLTLSSTVQTIVLAQRKIYVAGNLAIVSGWGYEAENGNVSSNLKAALVPMTTKQYCQKAYSSMINITNNMICAGFEEGGKDACQGDSGGPLVCNNMLIGIVSFGSGCARKDYPGVYTNVANYIKWIQNNSDYQPLNNSTKDIPLQWFLILLVSLIIAGFHS
ncbi:trypsin-like isoform X1 [Rhynchophorus ferrugineus]|uniref:trypsin-like isoform X1 n=1 Tax=Rhynchophorus ferrugineus TaxID=354439 RepID=UPI003FCD5837